LLLGVFVLSGFSSSVTTDTVRDTKSMYKALFIYNFATLVDWPSNYRKGDFIISVYSSEKGVYNQLSKKYSGKAIGNQEIKVLSVSSMSAINTKSHILFVSEEKSSNIGTLNSKFKGKSTLLITDKDGYLNKGSIINFVIDRTKNNRQSYEINKSNAKKHKLVIASKLSSLAAKVVE